MAWLNDGRFRDFVSVIWIHFMDEEQLDAGVFHRVVRLVHLLDLQLGRENVLCLGGLGKRPVVKSVERLFVVVCLGRGLRVLSWVVVGSRKRVR